MMHDIMDCLDESVAWLQSKGIDQTPVAGIILGTGLGELVSTVQAIKSFDYDAIPHFVQSTVEFHKGKLIYGMLEGKAVLIMQGRFHYYEGYSMQQITYPVRVMKALGIRHLLISNAAGGVNLNYKKGELVVIEDHINLLPDNPLRGLSDPRLGQRFADMSCPYDKKLRQVMEAVAAEQQLAIKKGVYAAVMGPNLETRAEYRWLKNMGADMVGMSTVPEVIVAAQIGLACAAVSVITDECDPDNLQPVNIKEIIETAGRADVKLSALFASVIGRLGEG